MVLYSAFTICAEHPGEFSEDSSHLFDGEEEEKGEGDDQGMKGRRNRKKARRQKKAKSFLENISPLFIFSLGGIRTLALGPQSTPGYCCAITAVNILSYIPIYKLFSKKNLFLRTSMYLFVLCRTWRQCG